VTETVQVASYRTQLEAELAARLLEGLDIPYVINSLEGMAYGPFAPGAMILVRAEDAELAREALTAAERGDGEPHVVRLGPPVSEHVARVISETLRRAGIQVLTRSSAGEGTPGEIAVFVRRDQADDARLLLEGMRRDER
jgi:nucleotide-binding universal stress UspA family protein